MVLSIGIILKAVTQNYTNQIVIFLSLHQPVTKKPNTKHQMSAIFVVIVSMQKEKEQSGLVSFKIATTTKKNGVYYLVFSHWLQKELKKI